METCSRELLEERDYLGTRERIESVQRLVEDEDIRVVRDGLREPGALPHPFAVASDFPIGGVEQSDALKRSFGSLAGVTPAVSVNGQQRADELEARYTWREGIELTAIPKHSEELLRPV